MNQLVHIEKEEILLTKNWEKIHVLERHGKLTKEFLDGFPSDYDNDR